MRRHVVTLNISDDVSWLKKMKDGCDEMGDYLQRHLPSQVMSSLLTQIVVVP